VRVELEWKEKETAAVLYVQVKSHRKLISLLIYLTLSRVELPFENVMPILGCLVNLVVL